MIDGPSNPTAFARTLRSKRLTNYVNNPAHIVKKGPPVWADRSVRTPALEMKNELYR